MTKTPVFLDQAQRSAQEELTRLQSTAHDQMVARLKDESAGRNASDEPSDRNFNSDLTSALYSLNGDSNDNANGDADTAALSSRAAAPVPTLSTSSSPALSPVLSTSASDDGASRL